MSVPGPLLITTRSDFARQVAALAPEVDLTIAAPDTVAVDVWASASAVFLDAEALPTLRTRTLPAAQHTCVVADTPPTPELFGDAVALRAEQVVELPRGASWLAEALRAAMRRATVIAVVGIGIGSTGIDAATIVALALAFDGLVRGERVAVVGLHRDQTVVQRLNALCADIPVPSRDRTARLTVVTRGDQPAPPGHTTRLITDLGDAHDLVILDTPPPSHQDGREALIRADVVVAVVTPDHLHHPDLAALTAPSSATADRVRVAILTTNPALAHGRGHAVTPPDTDPSRWITDPAFGRHCTAAVAVAAAAAAAAEPARQH